MKKCSKCGEHKNIIDFTKNKKCKQRYAGICKKCSNKYRKIWKQKNAKSLAEKRRKRYAETEGKKVKLREQERKRKLPLRVRCQLLRYGMLDRSKIKKIEFDSQYFTVSFLMKKIEQNPFCECCGKLLDITYKQNKKFNNASPSMDRVNSKIGYTKNNVAILCWECNKHKQDSTSEQLRMLANFMDVWGNEVPNSMDIFK